MKNSLSRTLSILTAVLLLPVVQAEVITSTDFTGRTVSGKTASNIPWTTNGVADPGDLTGLLKPRKLHPEQAPFSSTRLTPPFFIYLQHQPPFSPLHDALGHLTQKANF